MPQQLPSIDDMLLAAWNLATTQEEPAILVQIIALRMQDQQLRDNI